MNQMIPIRAETPWQRAKMEQISRADAAAFAGKGAVMANALIDA